MDPFERLALERHEFGEHGGVNASIEVSTTFTVLSASTLPQIFSGEKSPDNGACYVYGRSFNPTVRMLGRQLAALEGAEAGYACSSGMAAISATLLALCNSGDHIIASNAVYGGTFALLKNFLPQKAGIQTTFVDITNLEEVARAFTDKTKVLYTEALSNPTLVVADLPELAVLAHASGAQLVVDNTFTPAAVTPLSWGADVVVHSLTKFISGASDIIAGAVCGRAAFIRQLMDLQLGPVMLLGPTMDPKVASELALRLPHLGLRVREHARRALALATRLQQLGAKVQYPGLPTHPQHALWRRLSNQDYGAGGLVGVDLGSRQRAEVFMERLQNLHAFGYMAVSLGYFDTLMSLSAASTSSELDDGELRAAGISPGYVRMSVGITGTLEQRLEQLEEAYGFTCDCNECEVHATMMERQALLLSASNNKHSSGVRPADSGTSEHTVAPHRPHKRAHTQEPCAHDGARGHGHHDQRLVGNEHHLRTKRKHHHHHRHHGSHTDTIGHDASVAVDVDDDRAHVTEVSPDLELAS